MSAVTVNQEKTIKYSVICILLCSILYSPAPTNKKKAIMSKITVITPISHHVNY